MQSPDKYYKELDLNSLMNKKSLAFLSKGMGLSKLCLEEKNLGNLS